MSTTSCWIALPQAVAAAHSVDWEWIEKDWEVNKSPCDPPPGRNADRHRDPSEMSESLRTVQMKLVCQMRPPKGTMSRFVRGSRPYVVRERTLKLWILIPFSNFADLPRTVHSVQPQRELQTLEVVWQAHVYRPETIPSVTPAHLMCTELAVMLYVCETCCRLSGRFLTEAVWERVAEGVIRPQMKDITWGLETLHNAFLTR